MAIGSSPSILDLAATFGQAGYPYRLGNYYVGGSFVASNDYVPNVPASGVISLGNFIGAFKRLAAAGAYPSGVSGNRTGSGTVTTTTATISPTYGSGNFTLSVSYLSGDVHTPHISGLTVYFTKFVAAGTFYTGFYRCTLTDNVQTGVSAYADVQVDTEAF